MVVHQDLKIDCNRTAARIRNSPVFRADKRGGIDNFGPDLDIMKANVGYILRFNLEDGVYPRGMGVDDIGEFPSRVLCPVDGELKLPFDFTIS